VADPSRADRLQAAARLDELAGELDQISGWLDRFGDDADKAACVIECASRDLRAACWVIKPADHTRPEGWLAHRRMASNPDGRS
jgi:hypothetical protein